MAVPSHPLRLFVISAGTVVQRRGVEVPSELCFLECGVCDVAQLLKRDGLQSGVGVFFLNINLERKTNINIFSLLSH